MAVTEKKVIVVGGGLAGLSAAMKCAEKGCKVQIVSVTKVKRSHSVCAQGGINAAVNSMGEEDSEIIHAYDTIKGGDFLANQPPVLEMCLSAPAIIYMMDRFGCPFNRTTEGNLDFRRFGGTLYNRTAFCGASTGQQLLYALDEQVRRYEVKGMVEKFENHEFMRLVLDENGITRGVVIMDLFNLKLEVLKADAVVIATGGCGLIFKKSTNSTFCTGAANGRLYRQGMKYANGEFIQIHPTAIPGTDKMRLMSESARGEGGRIWVYGDSSKSITTADGRTIPCGVTGQPWYFLEELYPAFGNLVPRDIGAREILRICEMGLGIDGQMQVYLDVSHLSNERKRKLESILEIYEKFTGDDPRKIPMKIFPAVHYTMGGLWVDYELMTSVKGLYCTGEANFSDHGANRLGASALMQGLSDGYFVLPATISNYLAGEIFTKPIPTDHPAFIEAEKGARSREEKLLSIKGKRTVDDFHKALGKIMWEYCGMARTAEGLTKARNLIQQLRKEFWEDVNIPGQIEDFNPELDKANRVADFIELGELMVIDALNRNESCGGHFRTEYQDAGEAKRDDANYAYVAAWEHTSVDADPVLHKEALMYENIEMQVRSYK